MSGRNYCIASAFEALPAKLRSTPKISVSVLPPAFSITFLQKRGDRDQRLCHTMSETNSAILLSNVETEKEKQKEKECNVIIRGLKKLPKHGAEKIIDIFSFLEIDTVPVKFDSIGTTNEQNMQLPVVKMSNPKVKWELIRKAKKLRDDTGLKDVYINPDLTPEQGKMRFKARNKLRELRQSNPLKQFRIKSGRIVETPQSLA